MTKEDDGRTRVRASPFRDAPQGIIDFRTEVSRLEEVYEAQKSAFHKRQEHYGDFMNLCWIMFLPFSVLTLSVLYASSSALIIFLFFLVLGLSVMYGLKSAFLEHRLTKKGDDVRYRLSYTHDSEIAQLKCIFISTILFAIGLVYLCKIHYSLISLVIPFLLLAVPLVLGNLDRRREALRDLQELDDLEDKRQRIQCLREQIPEPGAEALLFAAQDIQDLRGKP